MATGAAAALSLDLVLPRCSEYRAVLEAWATIADHKDAMARVLPPTQTWRASTSGLVTESYHEQHRAAVRIEWHASACLFYELADPLTFTFRADDAARIFGALDKEAQVRWSRPLTAGPALSVPHTLVYFFAKTGEKSRDRMLIEQEAEEPSPRQVAPWTAEATLKVHLSALVQHVDTLSVIHARTIVCTVDVARRQVLLWTYGTAGIGTYALNGVRVEESSVRDGAPATVTVALSLNHLKRRLTLLSSCCEHVQVQVHRTEGVRLVGLMRHGEGHVILELPIQADVRLPLFAARGSLDDTFGRTAPVVAPAASAESSAI
jgi:hypothetical protein